MARPASPLDLPLHPNIRILAQCSRGFLPSPHDGASNVVCSDRVAELGAVVLRVIDEGNLEPKPFVWTADPRKMLAAVSRGRKVLDSIN